VVVRHGWAGFLAWAVAGAFAALAIAAAPSFGLLLVPVALALVMLLARRVRTWPEALGALEGVAAVVLLIGFLNLGSSPCASGVVSYGPGQSSVECGGLSPGPFLVAGSVLVLAGVAL
jgi:cell division protein FtsW (lipid II flippase)